jgi:hypothetical protein
MPEFRTSRSEMDAAGIDTAGACLPGLDMKFVQQRVDEGEADQIFIRLSAPSPNALGRALEAANQFALGGAGQSRPAAIGEVEGPEADATRRRGWLAPERGSACGRTLRLSPP